jgi:hypothetical protein
LGRRRSTAALLPYWWRRKALQQAFMDDGFGKVMVSLAGGLLPRPVRLLRSLSLGQLVSVELEGGYRGQGYVAWMPGPLHHRQERAVTHPLDRTPQRFPWDLRRPPPRRKPGWGAKVSRECRHMYPTWIHRESIIGTIVKMTSVSMSAMRSNTKGGDTLFLENLFFSIST